MSPTCTTALTCGSALTESMNAGVAWNSAVAVGLMPYGASPYTARVGAPCGEAVAGRAIDKVPAAARATAALMDTKSFRIDGPSGGASTRTLVRCPSTFTGLPVVLWILARGCGRATPYRWGGR